MAGRKLRSVVTLFVLFALLLGCVRASFASVLVNGEPLQNYGNADSWNGWVELDTGIPFTFASTLTSWGIYAEGAGAIELLILQQSGSVYNVVGQSAVVNAVAGVNDFSLATPVSVQAGDYLGWWQASPTSILSFGGGGPLVYATANGSYPSAAPSSFSTGSIAWSGNRTYAIAVFAPEPSGIATETAFFALAALCLGWRRRGLNCIFKPRAVMRHRV